MWVVEKAPGVLTFAALLSPELLLYDHFQNAHLHVVLSISLCTTAIFTLVYLFKDAVTSLKAGTRFYSSLQPQCFTHSRH